MYFLYLIFLYLIFVDYNNNFLIKGLFNYLFLVLLRKVKINYLLIVILK